MAYSTRDDSGVTDVIGDSHPAKLRGLTRVRMESQPSEPIIRDGAPPEWAKTWPHWMMEVRYPRDGATRWERVGIGHTSSCRVAPGADSEVIVGTVLRCYPCQPDSPLPAAWPENRMNLEPEGT